MSLDYAHIKDEAEQQIQSCTDAESLNALRVKYLGRSGIIQELMAKIPTLPQEERKAYGASVNALKNQISQILSQKETALSETLALSSEAFLDITLPGKRPSLGRLHPLTQVESEIIEVFGHLGFKVFKGPEVETEYNNFEALNIPLEHPSRDAFDTFYIKPQATGSMPQAKNKNANVKEACGLEHEACSRFLLRSHTSPAQIRVLKENKPPLAVVIPGRVYRPDAVDASHSFMFHQVEGLAISESLRFSDLKGLLIAFAQEMFGTQTKLRFRPSFFPFTEPSAEVDVSCFLCKTKGCSVCKQTGWLEILGCGMVHPHVLKSCGCDPRRWRGFAFGMGVERIAMLKFGITDIRLFFENDIRFLEQF